MFSSLIHGKPNDADELRRANADSQRPLSSRATPASAGCSAAPRRAYFCATARRSATRSRATWSTALTSSNRVVG